MNKKGLQRLILFKPKQNKTIIENKLNVDILQVYKYTDAGKYETQATLHYSGTKRLLTYWL